MASCELRLAVPADLEAITVLLGQLGYPASATEVARRLQPVIDSSEHALLVASIDGRVIGCIHVLLISSLDAGRYAEIGAFVVDEDHRGQGLGRRLLAAAEDWSRRQGVNKLRVRSRIDRIETLAWYRQQGFADTKVQQVFDKRLEG